MKKLKLLLFSATPIVVGYLMHFAIYEYNWFGTINSIIGIIFCIYWYFVGCMRVISGKRNLAVFSCPKLLKGDANRGRNKFELLLWQRVGAVFVFQNTKGFIYKSNIIKINLNFTKNPQFPSDSACGTGSFLIAGMDKIEKTQLFILWFNLICFLMIIFPISLSIQYFII